MKSTTSKRQKRQTRQKRVTRKKYTGGVNGLLKALRTCNFRKVKKIISKNPKLVVQYISLFGSNNTPLHIAVMAGEAGMYYTYYSKKRLKKCFKICAFLIHTAQSKPQEVFEDIIKSRHLPGYTNSLYYTDFINAQCDFGNTPLYLALRVNNLNISKLLIENGADLNIRGDSHQTPYDMIMEYPRGINKKYDAFLDFVDQHIKVQKATEEFGKTAKAFRLKDYADYMDDDDEDDDDAMDIEEDDEDDMSIVSRRSRSSSRASSRSKSSSRKSKSR